MAAITIQGKTQKYLFSVVETTYEDMPDWGGIYIAVNASGMGIHIDNCVAIGSCTSFSEYANKIRTFTEGKCSHIYLLPEFENIRRHFTLEDLMRTEAFRGVTLKTLELETLGLDTIIQQEFEQKDNNGTKEEEIT